MSGNFIVEFAGINSPILAVMHACAGRVVVCSLYCPTEVCHLDMVVGLMHRWPGQLFNLKERS